MLILPRLWIMLPLCRGFSELFTVFILWHRICLTLELMNPSHLVILLCHRVLYRIIACSLPVFAFLKTPIQLWLCHIPYYLWYGTIWAPFIYLAVMCDSVYLWYMVLGYLICIAIGCYEVWHVWCLGWYRRWISSWIIHVPWRYEIAWLVNFEAYC